MNFTSQICTTREQSERLLALGLKKETADMCWVTITLHGTPVTYSSQESWLDYSIISDNHFPAWSLHRLMEIYTNGFNDSNWNMAKFNWDNLIDCIECRIYEGYFNTEYLEQ